MNDAQAYDRLSVHVIGGPKLPDVYSSEVGFLHRLGTLVLRSGDVAFVMVNSATRKYAFDSQGDIELRPIDNGPLPGGCILTAVSWNEDARSTGYGHGCLLIDAPESGHIGTMLRIDFGRGEEQPSLMMKPEDPTSRAALLDTGDPYADHEADSYNPVEVVPEPDLTGQLLETGWFRHVDEQQPDGSVSGELACGKPFTFAVQGERATLTIKHRRVSRLADILLSITVLVIVAVATLLTDVKLSIGSMAIPLLGVVAGLLIPAALVVMLVAYRRQRDKVFKTYSVTAQADNQPIDRAIYLMERYLDEQG